LVRKRQFSPCGSFQFRRQVSNFLQGSKELLLDPEIISPHQNAISSLAVDSIFGRFVLAGSADATVSVYDLSHWGSEGFARKLTHSSSFARFRPVARSLKVPFGLRPDDERAALEIPSGHSSAITHVQWYPMDTGAFVSCATDGCLLLWDTNRMEPVLKATPFAESLEDEEASATWGSAHWQPLGNHSLVATGSWVDSCLRLVDIRSGASSHQLTGHSRGVTAVQWSPTNPFIVASGSKDKSIRLWDIRKSGSQACLAVLGRDWVAFEDIAHPPYQGDYSHLQKYAVSVQKWKNQNRKRKLGLNSNGKVVAVAPNNFNQVQRQGIKSHFSHVAAISFLPGGQTLASVGGDGEVLLWDMRHGPTLLDRRFLAHGGRPAATESQRRASLCVDADEGILWVGNNSEILGFSLEGGTPKHVLRGHLQNITSLDRIRPEMTLISGSSDGMILSWGKPKGSLFASRRVVIAEDKDNW
jgi:DNA excision repair protein ERCC-8